MHATRLVWYGGKTSPRLVSLRHVPKKFLAKKTFCHAREGHGVAVLYIYCVHTTQGECTWGQCHYANLLSLIDSITCTSCATPSSLSRHLHLPRTHRHTFLTHISHTRGCRKRWPIRSVGGSFDRHSSVGSKNEA